MLVEIWYIVFITYYRMERYFTWEVTVLLITYKGFLERITWCCDYCSFLDFGHTVSTVGRSYFVCHLSYITTVSCDSWLHANSYSSQFALYFSTQPEHLCPVRFTSASAPTDLSTSCFCLAFSAAQAELLKWSLIVAGDKFMHDELCAWLRLWHQNAAVAASLGGQYLLWLCRYDEEFIKVCLDIFICAETSCYVFGEYDAINSSIHVM